MSAPMSAALLLERLRRHYIKPGEDLRGVVFLPEVSLGSRRADALYVGFFSSRGKHLVGHEIKVARSDWLHELDEPAKAEAWEPNCHAWYVVAPDTDVVRTEELPHGWGLMIPGRSKTRMQIVVKAAIHPERTPSWEATHALVQRVDSLRIKEVQEDRQKSRERLYADIEEQVERRVQTATGDAILRADRDRLRAQLDELEKILGLRVVGNGWRDDDVSVEEIRTSFASWLRADRQVQRAIAHRATDLSHARRALSEAETALDALHRDRA